MVVGWQRRRPPLACMLNCLEYTSTESLGLALRHTWAWAWLSCGHWGATCRQSRIQKAITWSAIRLAAARPLPSLATGNGICVDSLDLSNHGWEAREAAQDSVWLVLTGCKQQGNGRRQPTAARRVLQESTHHSHPSQGLVRAHHGATQLSDMSQGHLKLLGGIVHWYGSSSGGLPDRGRLIDARWRQCLALTTMCNTRAAESWESGSYTTVNAW